MTVRSLSTRRQIAKDAAGVTRSAREVRASLLSVVKLINRTSREAETVTDDGIETMGWVRSSERDRLEDFYKAMTLRCGRAERLLPRQHWPHRIQPPAGRRYD